MTVPQLVDVLERARRNSDDALLDLVVREVDRRERAATATAGRSSPWFVRKTRPDQWGLFATTGYADQPYGLFNTQEEAERELRFVQRQEWSRSAPSPWRHTRDPQKTLAGMPKRRQAVQLTRAMEQQIGHVISVEYSSNFEDARDDAAVIARQLGMRPSEVRAYINSRVGPRRAGPPRW